MDYESHLDFLTTKLRQCWQEVVTINCANSVLNAQGFTLEAKDVILSI